MISSWFLVLVAFNVVFSLLNFRWCIFWVSEPQKTMVVQFCSKSLWFIVVPSSFPTLAIKPTVTPCAWAMSGATNWKGWPRQATQCQTSIRPSKKKTQTWQQYYQSSKKEPFKKKHAAMGHGCIYLFQLFLGGKGGEGPVMSIEFHTWNSPKKNSHGSWTKLSNHPFGFQSFGRPTGTTSTCGST